LEAPWQARSLSGAPLKVIARRLGQVRDRRPDGWRRPPDSETAAWKLLWALVGAVAFTVVMFYFGLI
jgi:hypothetical protein